MQCQLLEDTLKGAWKVMNKFGLKCKLLKEKFLIE